MTTKDTKNTKNTKNAKSEKRKAESGKREDVKRETLDVTKDFPPPFQGEG